MSTHDAPVATPIAAEQDPFVRIVPTQLADTLRQKSEKIRPLVIDVRGNDYKDGRIASAANPTFTTTRRSTRSWRMRGLFCARRFASRLEVLLANEEKKPNVQVLTGDYKDFSEQFKDDAELLEKESSASA